MTACRSDPEEEDGYGSSWRREWDGERYHAREGPPLGACH